MSTVVEQSRELLEQAKQLQQQGKSRESAAAFRKLIELGALKAQGHYGLGLVLLELREFGAAAAQLEQCLAIDPGNANATFYLGETWAARNTPDVARSFYRRALELDPQHPGALERLGQSPSRPSKQSGTAPAPLPQSVPGVAPAGLGFYALIQNDPSALARQVVQLIDSLRMTVRPALTAYLGRIVALALVCLLPALLIGLIPGGSSSNTLKRVPRRTLPQSATSAITWVQPALLAAGILLPLAYVIRVRSTKYTLTQGTLQISRGVLSKRVQNIELYRVVDIEFAQSWLNRMTGDGSLILSVEGVGGQRGATRMTLTGIARGDQLRDIFEKLRSLVLLLRTGQWGKGVIF